MRQQGVYLLVLILLLVLWAGATGGGLTSCRDAGPVPSVEGEPGPQIPRPLLVAGAADTWQHKAFYMACHQDPDRSFWINGAPMAVCSRCYGVYVSLAIGWLCIPLFIWAGLDFSLRAKILLISAGILNLVDIVGNLLGFWENTLTSRAALGALLGASVVILLTDEFVKKE